jgi:hypothetical protein
MISNQVGVQALFTTAAVPALCACLAAFALSRTATRTTPAGG